MDPELQDRVMGVEVQGVDMFGSNIGFIKMNVKAQGDNGMIPGITVLRGNAVVLIMVINNEYTPLVVQPRVPAGKLKMKELPAGMMDDSGDIKGKMVDEVREELGIVIDSRKLVDLTELFGHPNGIYTSPGLLDEAVHILYYEVEIPEEELHELVGRKTGNIEEGEDITVKLVKTSSLPNHLDGTIGYSTLFFYEKYVSSTETDSL